ncbi:hypothetical protein J2I48_15410 [Fibrella sp. HMF5036]|uniref:Uncharacterized protein n=2 Tax=Fibrella aquatilis TaxID=2817059 RepID=A0A939G719_9BACT|nr:hypothetical protein [Fibrella aquatilis]
MRLIRQLAKTLKFKAIVQKETPKQKREREFLDSFDKRAEEVKAHLRDDIKLQSAKDFLDQL